MCLLRKLTFNLTKFRKREMKEQDEFNKEQYQQKQAILVKKLIVALNKGGIYMSEYTIGLDNVVFTKGDKVFKMSHHSFYRYSGICNIYKETENTMTPIPVTDEMYLFDFIKPIVEKSFGI